ncbi:hypothetical protein DFH08DRAFT_473632 [Mycena albidolilacea]|uniref:HNH nuclease domain-containing protein n=1 Tax=Mycena albidolilacea TaxID=1033008 RepID=A0AAD7AFK9_9AGAR|nr:hypothetical protein DFH08DRAFT_473632 [Mycena albidolilacea]
MLEKTPLAPNLSRTAKQLYATPPRFVTMIGAAAIDKLAEVSPGGRRCILTNEEYPRIAIEAAHLLPRATKPRLLTILELAFNLKYKQLHIDTTRNLVYLRADIHRSFNHDGFLLLPTRKDLQRVIDFTLSENEPTKTYKEVRRLRLSISRPQ